MGWLHINRGGCNLTMGGCIIALFGFVVIKTFSFIIDIRML